MLQRVIIHQNNRSQATSKVEPHVHDTCFVDETIKLTFRKTTQWLQVKHVLLSNYSQHKSNVKQLYTLCKYYCNILCTRIKKMNNTF